MSFRAMAMIGVAGIALSACDKIADTSKAVQSVTYKAFSDTKSSWKDFFTYHPPLPDPLPQTRYCYQMQSDIVCYDSEQTTLTSRLLGFQDGDTISWVQPGGGSLGASGGGPVALRPIAPETYATKDVSIGWGTMFQSTFGSSASSSGGVAANQIETQNLPPINSVEKVK
jgi:hypothetical protein